MVNHRSRIDGDSLPTPRTDRYRILHVDDDPEVVDLTADFLERERDDFDVLTDTSARDGLDRLRDEEIDCIVSDYDMPEMDGLEFLEEVRSEYPDLPFILFTGKGSEEIASEAISAGVTDYLQKGRGTDQYTLLANRITNAVTGYQARQQMVRGFKAIETAREGISILDEDGHFLYVNAAFADIVGYAREELLDAHWELLFPEDDTDIMHEEILPTVPVDGRWTGVTTYVRADGERIQVDHALSYTEEGVMICLIRDMTHDEAREGPIVTDRRFVEDIFDALTDLFIVLDTEGTISRVNEYTIQETGYSGTDLMAMEWEELFAAEDRDQATATFREAIETGEATAELVLTTEGGTSIPYECKLRRVTDTDGDVIGAAAIGRDVGDRQRRERELQRQNDRLEEFASIVSHDLQNPLNVAQGRLELAQEECDSEHLAPATRAVERGLTLIDDLLTLAREGEQVSEVEPVALPELAQECWETVPTAGASLTVATEQTIRADRGRLKQLLENLIRNAVEHGGEEVTVTIGKLADGFYVADDGPGIPEEKRDQVFEAGYSTVSDGTGFGLRIVKQVVEAHDWEISVTDSDTGGARFEITGVEPANT